ncbi:MAG: hypothetical protein K1X55_14055 [Chitinophagales bacterium]|nr:hypothetical protein [Chitinophagales bacterium]
MKSIFILFFIQSLVYQSCSPSKQPKEGIKPLEAESSLVQYLSLEEKIIDTYQKTQLDKTSNVGCIKVSDLSLISDEGLNKILPKTSFYTAIITNCAHYEYNNGNIPTIVSLSSLDSSDVRLFLPLDYTTSDFFFEQFYGSFISDKENSCFSITKLFLKTLTRTAFNCDKELKNLSYTVKSSYGKTVITTTWLEHCQEMSGELKTTKEYLETKNTIFHFKKDTLIGIDYEDWE